MFRSASGGARKKHQTTSSCQPPHVQKRLLPIRVVFKTLARTSDVESVSIKLVSRTNDINTRPSTHIYSSVLTINEEITDRAVDVERPDL